MTYARNARRSVTARLALVAAVAVVAVVALAATTANAGAKTVWLCQPGRNPTRALRVCRRPSTRRHSNRCGRPTPTGRQAPTFDCFYVYPTVSDQTTTLSNRRIDPEQRSIALYQAARYSQRCRVFAPMYRQVTLTALNSGNTESPAQLKVPLDDVTAAFKLYLRKYNHGPTVRADRPLAGLVRARADDQKVIDPKPFRREWCRRSCWAATCSSRTARMSGARSSTFQPAGRSPTSTASSRFRRSTSRSPSNSLFGRTTVAGEHALCVNPVALQGRSR